MKKLLYISMLTLFLASCDKQIPLVPGAGPFSPNSTTNSSDNNDDSITDPDKDDDHDVDEGQGLNNTIDFVKGNIGITDPDKDDDHDVDEGSGQVKVN